MQFAITPEIFAKYPDLNIGVIVAKGIDNTGENKEVLTMLKGECERIKQYYQLDTLKEEPQLAAWREAYRAFGAKPKKYTCSVENLYRMVLEGVELRHINKLVDIYNYISLKHMIPVGGDDLNGVDGGITLRLASGDEQFIRLNSTEVDHPKEGEVIYADDKEVLCRRWNWRECDKSKMTENTVDVTLVVEGLPPSSAQQVSEIIDELALLTEKYCGGEIDKQILNSDNPSFVIS